MCLQVGKGAENTKDKSIYSIHAGHNTEKMTGLSMQDKTSECPFRVFIVVRYLYLRGGSLEGIRSFGPKSSLELCVAKS
jgi:hypothetical protein